MWLERPPHGVLPVVFRWHCGVFPPEGREGREKLLRIVLVKRGGVAQFGHSVYERLPLRGIEICMLCHGVRKGAEAPAKVRERRLEGREWSRDGSALGADAAKV